MSEHTPECAARTAAYERRCKAFLAHWPHCCQDCHATGEVYDLEEEPDFCESCLLNDECPRCSGPFVYRDGNSRCPSCGWEMGEEFLDWPPDCDCLQQLTFTEGES